jgi:DNA-binding transcriptional LysR family regulator
VAAAGVTPARGRTCNNVMVTLQAMRSGAALGLHPIRVAEDDRLEGKVKLLKVTPRIPAHSISICHQTSEAGEGLHGFIRMLKE